MSRGNRKQCKRLGLSTILAVVLAAAFAAATAHAADPPRVLGVTPASGNVYGVTSGATSGGTTVRLRGENFAGASSVVFGSTQAASFTVDSSSQITAVSPAGTSGRVHVRVTTANGTSATVPGDLFRYGSNTPHNLSVDVVGATQVALRWQAPAGVAGVLGYRIYRDGALIQSISGALRTNFLDIGLATASTHSYAVAAQTLAGDTAQSSSISATTGSPQVINSCSGTLTSGHYVLGADLDIDPLVGNHCLVLAPGSSDISIDCNGHSIRTANTGRSGIYVANSSHFLIANCVLPHSYVEPNDSGGLTVSNSDFGVIANNSFHGQPGDDSVPQDPFQTGGSNVVYIGNTLSSSQLAVSNSSDNYIGHNTVTEPGNLSSSANVSVSAGSNNVIDSNVLDGGVASWNIANPYVGSDDGILISNEWGDVLENNQISGVWDAGIETTSAVYSTAMVGNTIASANVAGILAPHNWSSSWFNNSLIGNTVSDSPFLFLVETGDQIGTDPVYFKFNSFDGNTFTNPRAIAGGTMASSIFDTSQFPSATKIVSDNVVSNNNFGSVLPAPFVSPGAFSSNVGNRCTPAVGTIPQLSCSGYSAAAPTVTGVSPSSGSPGTSVSVSGSGFTGAQSITLWKDQNDPLSTTMQNCSGGIPATTCFTVNSDSSITYPAPLINAGTPFQGDIRVSSSEGTRPQNLSDKFTLLPTSVTPQFTSPQNGATISNNAVTAQFVAPAGAKKVLCALGDTTVGGVVPSGTTCAAPSVSYSNLTWGHSYTIFLTVFDFVDNATVATVSFDVPQLPPPPAITITSPAEGSIVSSTTLNATFSLFDSGGGLDTSVCAVYDRTIGQQVGLASCSPPNATFAGLAPGHNFWFQVWSWDLLGQSSATQVGFTVDGTPPPVPAITSPGNNSLIATQSPVVAGTASENGSTVKVFDGTTLVCQATVSSGAWSCTPSAPLGNLSAHSLSATASDTLGNTSSASSVSTVTVDTGAADAVVSGSTLTITTNSGRADALQIAKSGTNFTIAQASPAWLKAGSGCTNSDATHVTCSTTGVTTININTGDMNDTISSNSTVTVNQSILGGAGGDTITGGAGNDTITGGTGADTMNGGSGIDAVSYADHSTDVAASANGVANDDGSAAEGDTIAADVENLTGGSGNDTLFSASGANALDCGAGSSDTVSYAKLTAAVTVSLATTTAQNTGGGGSDTIVRCENLTGSQAGDSLTGSSSANTLDGGPGTSGTDTINPAGGTDTVSYASALAGVTVNLATTNQSTGGAGSDGITNAENLTGSSFNDILSGNRNANVLTGGLGVDTVNAGTGNDTVVVKDGINDANTVCGAGSDVLTADLFTIGDTNSNGDCETVSRS